MARWVNRVNKASLRSVETSSRHDFFEPALSFDLSLSHKSPLHGFYMLEVNDSHPFAANLSALYYQNASTDFNPNKSFFLPLGRRKTVKRVVYFPELSDVFKWDISDGVAIGDSVCLKLSKISRRFAKKMLTKKLLSNGCFLEDFAEMDLLDLYGRYDAVFSAKNQRALDYKGWITEVENFSPAIKNECTKFSIILPVYNPSIEHLANAMSSVLSQTYSNWELCISDDCSIDPAVRDLILQWAAKDSRIKYVFRLENGNISAASNSALSISTGEYVTLLDHDDVLAPCALNEVALVLASGPADIIYSDEDKIDENNVRYEPHFKSDFNFELILSHNYISHLGVYKRSLVEKVGGFRLGYEGCQDYDLVLRCLAESNVSKIKHIPKILYHWRAIEGSTAQDASQKSYTSLAGLKALKDAVYKIDNQWTVEIADLPNTYKVNRPIIKTPLVSIIIPTKDQKDLLESCVDSILLKTELTNYEIVIVDNGSVERETKKYLSKLSEKENIRVLNYSAPFNFSAINNYAVSQCPESEFVLLLNNDVEVINKGWLSEMVSLAKQEDVGCVGAKLYYTNGLIQHAGVILGIGGVAGHSHKCFSQDHHGYFSRLKLRQDLSAVTAACLLVKKSVYNQVGGLNEEDLTIAFNDVDFCLKVRDLGLRNVWTPFAELYHHESISRGAEDTPEKIQRFNKEASYMKDRWGASLLSDPYYNENLTLEHENFTIRACK